MANIDELHFAVILDYSDFQKQVSACKDLAKELNSELSDALNFKKHIQSAPLKTYQKEMQKASKATKDAEKNTKDYGRAVQGANSQMGNATKVLRTLSQLTGVAFSVVGIRRFLSTLIDVTGQFEVQKMALRNMLQDIDGADKIFEDLYNFSSKSTYRFSELAKYAKQLAAFNIDQDSLLETTKMLGDVASGVGVSMDRIILAYGHVKSSGFLRGIQLRSFSQNGVPVLEELSKMLTEIEGKTVSLGDVFDKMMKREITFEMVEEAFKRMTSEGGKFYQMQEVLAKTLAGQINILKGKWENLMYAMGESQEGILKGVVTALTKIVSNIDAFGQALVKTITVVGTYKLAIFAATAATEGWAVASSGVIAALNRLTAALASNPYTLIGLAAATAALAIINVVQNTSKLTDTQKALNKEYEKWQKNLVAEVSELDSLYAKLRLAKKGTEEYDSARRALENRFGTYINELKQEGVAVDDLATQYNNLKAKIEEATYARFVDNARKNIDETHAEQIGTLVYGNGRDYFTAAGLVSELGLSPRDAAALHSIVLGQKSYDDVLRSGMYPELIKALNEGYVHTGGGDSGPMKAMDFLEVLTDRVKKANDEWEEGKSAIEEYANSLLKVTGAGGGAGGGDTAGYVKLKDILKNINDTQKEIDEMVKKANGPGLLVDLTKGIDEQADLQKLYDRLDEFKKEYKSITGKDYDKSSREAATAAAKEEREEIKIIKAQIAILEKYKDARDKLEPYFGDQTDLQLSKLFGARDYSTLDTELQELIASLRALGDEGAQAADQIEARLGMDALSLLLAKQRDLKKYDDNLKKYLGEDFSYSGSSLEYKTSRILAEYNTKVATATREYEELHKNLVALGQNTSELEAQFQAQLAQLAADRDNKIAELAKSIYGKQTGNLNLTEWAHKSGKEIKEIISALRNVQVPKELADMLDEGALNALSDALKELASEDIEKALTKLDDNRLRNLQKAASVVSSIAGAVKEYAEASGNDNLAAMAEALSFIADTAGAVFDRLAQGDYAGAVLAVVGGIAKEIMAAATAAAQLNAALAEAVEKSRVLGMSKDLKAGVENLFGESGLRKIRNAAELAEKLRKTAYDGKGKFLSGRDAFFLPKWETMIGNLAAGVGGELYDEYGNLNADTLKLILGTYKKLDTESKQWIQHAIDDTEAYKNAMEQLDEVLNDVFGNIAGQAADKIVEQWKARGDAALDYADILDDVATRYAKMITESMLIDSVLTPDFKDQLTALVRSGDTENAMGLVLSGLEQIQLMAPAVEEALEPLLPYIKGGSSSDSLKDGINKELVEGNSSLIASYMNAMRADLSVLRTLQSSGWQDVRLVRENVPTLVEYSAQIAANTYDSAQASQAILAKLQSVIGNSTNGGSAVRTMK